MSAAEAEEMPVQDVAIDVPEQAEPVEEPAAEDVAVEDVAKPEDEEPEA